MRESTSLVSLIAGGLTAFGFVAAIFLTSESAFAADAAAPAAVSEQAPSCACPGASNRRTKPKYAELKSDESDARTLDAGDEIAALSSVQHALTGTADGATYVWRRDNGRLSGLVRPTSSFKSVDGQVCRHIVVMLTTGSKTRKAEGVACRDPLGIWTLEG